MFKRKNFALFVPGIVTGFDSPLGELLQLPSARFVGTLLISFLTLAAIIGAIWAPETRGKTLQQIEAERYAA